VKISATYGKRLNTSAFGNNRVESNLSNQQSPMVPSCPRATSRNAGGRDGTSVHQRLGDGGKGAVVRTSIGENGIPGGADQSQSLIRRMPSKSRDADEFLYNPCATSDMLNPSESPKTGIKQIAEEAEARHIADASIAPNVVHVLKKLKIVSGKPEKVAKSIDAGKQSRKRNNARKKKVANSAMPTDSGGASTKSVRPAHAPSVETDRGGTQEAFQVKMSHPPERGEQQITSNSTPCAIEPVRNGQYPVQAGLNPTINNNLRFISADALARASRTAALLERVRLQSIDPRRVVAKGRGGRTSASAHGGAGDA
jgi:hypothetical protein